MAIVCDFRECQKVLDPADQHTMTVNSNRYVVCERCEEKFKEYLAMYLFKPSAAESALALPNNRPAVLLPMPVEFSERKFVSVSRPEFSTNFVPPPQRTAFTYVASSIDLSNGYHRG